RLSVPVILKVGLHQMKLLTSTLVALVLCVTQATAQEPRAFVCRWWPRGRTVRFSGPHRRRGLRRPCPPILTRPGPHCKRQHRGCDENTGYFCDYRRVRTSGCSTRLDSFFNPKGRGAVT